MKLLHRVVVAENTSATRGWSLVMVSLSSQDGSSPSSPVLLWSWDSMAPASWISRTGRVFVADGSWGEGGSAAVFILLLDS